MLHCQDGEDEKKKIEKEKILLEIARILEQKNLLSAEECLRFAELVRNCKIE